jgi:hypothetical protein
MQRIKGGPNIRGPHSRTGLGAATADYNAFLKGGKNATYSSGDVTCSKLDIGTTGGEPQCWLDSYPTGASASGPIVDMQKAADNFLNVVPGFHFLVSQSGQQVQARTPDGKVYAIQDPIMLANIDKLSLEPNPVFVEGGGYDGVVGPGSKGWILTAISIAGSLAPFPNNVTQAFMSGGANADLALYASDIANYLNSVTQDYPNLIRSYMDQYRPAPALVPEAMPAVAAALGVKPSSNAGLLIGLGLAVVLAIGIVAAVMTRKSEVPMKRRKTSGSRTGRWQAAY